MAPEVRHDRESPAPGPEAPAGSAEGRAKASAVSRRAIAIGMACAVVTALANPWLRMGWGAPGSATDILPQMPLALFVLIVMLNVLAARRGWRTLGKGELLVIFAIGFVGGSVCSRVPAVVGYIATPEGQTGSQWDLYARPLLSPSFHLQDEEVARGYLTGTIPSFGAELEEHRRTIRDIEERLAERRKEAASGSRTVAGDELLSRYERAELDMARELAGQLEPVVARVREMEDEAAILEARAKDKQAKLAAIEAGLSRERGGPQATPAEGGEPEERRRALLIEAEQARARLSELRALGEEEARAYWRRRVRRAWIPPLVSWGILIGGIAAFGFGFTALIRRQWMENERIMTPLLEAPTMLLETREGRSMFQNRVFLGGFAFGLIYVIWNTIPMLYPAWPGLTLQLEPWQHLFGYKYGSPPNPIIIVRLFVPVFAISFFVRRDVLFSIVFFWIAGAFWLRYLSYTSSFFTPVYPGEGHIFNCNANWVSMGALVGFGLVTLFMSRRFLMQVARKAIGRRSGLDDSTELLPYRASTILVIAGLGGLFFSLLRFGIAPWLAVVFTLGAAVVIISATRLVLETGAMFFSTPIGFADAMLYSIRNSLQSAWTSVAGLACGHVYMGGRNFTAQAMGHANKLAGRLPGERRRLGLVLAGAIVCCTLACVYSQLAMSYQMGVESTRNNSPTMRHPRTPLNETVRTLASAGVPPIHLERGETPESVAQSEAFDLAREEGLKVPNVDSRRGRFFLGGFFGIVVLSLLRAYVAWWPIHPIGLLLCHSGAASHAFFSVFLAWLVKFLTFRIGGVGGLRKVSPCFVGILAGFAVGIAIAWVMGIGAGIYDCARLNHWTWEVFLQRKWVNLTHWAS